MEPNAETIAGHHDHIAALETALGKARSKFRTATVERRTFLLIGFSLAVPELLRFFTQVPVPQWVAAGLGIIGVFFMFAAFGIDPIQPKVEVEKLESIRRVYYNLFNINEDKGYFDRLVKINVENLAEYYSLVKVHTQQSFRLAAAMATLGFLLILAGLVISYTEGVADNLSYVSTGAGVVVELTGGLFFYLYSQTVRQLKGYHDSLLDVQNILLSFKLVESTDDTKERSVMTQKMMEFLASKRISI